MSHCLKIPILYIGDFRFVDEHSWSYLSESWPSSSWGWTNNVALAAWTRRQWTSDCRQEPVDKCWVRQLSSGCRSCPCCPGWSRFRSDCDWRWRHRSSCSRSSRRNLHLFNQTFPMYHLIWLYKKSGPCFGRFPQFSSTSSGIEFTYRGTSYL